MSAYRLAIKVLLLLLGVGWCAACSAPSTLSVEAPFARNSKTIGLSVHTDVYHDDTNTMVHELWRVDLEKNPFQSQRILTSTTELALVDCRPFDVQCVALISDVDGVSQLRRWQVTPTQWEEITPPQIIQGFPGNIRASSPQGTWLSGYGGPDIRSLYFQAYGQSSLITMTQYPYADCYGPKQLSPAGGYLALGCWEMDKYPEPGVYPSPVRQYFRLIKTDNTGEYTLTLPATYFFYKYYLCCRQGIPPRPPDFAWSPDGTELAFVAAFSPPITLTESGTPQPNGTLSYQLFGGIYSISLQDKTISKWTEVGGGSVPLAWSPDGKEIAYTTGRIAYVVSRDGSERQIGSIDGIESLFWSPDGAYLVVQGIDKDIDYHMQLWVIPLADGVWRKLDLPGEVMDMRWVTLNAP